MEKKRPGGFRELWKGKERSGEVREGQGSSGDLRLGHSSLELGISGEVTMEISSGGGHGRSGEGNGFRGVGVRGGHGRSGEVGQRLAQKKEHAMMYKIKKNLA